MSPDPFKSDYAPVTTNLTTAAADPSHATIVASTTTASQNGSRNKKRLVYIILYYILAVTVAVFNKFVIGGGSMNFPLMLSACSAFIQAAMAAVSLAILGILRQTITQKLTFNQYVTAVMPCAIASGLDIGISNSSLRFVSLSFYTMVKSSAPIFVLASALLLGLEKPSFGLFMIMGVIAGGTLMTVWTDSGVKGFDVSGFLMVLSAAMLSGVRWSLTQLIIEEHSNEAGSARKLTSAGPLATILYLAPIAGVLMFAMSLVVEGVGQFARYTARNIPYVSVIFATSGVLTFALILTEYKVVQETSVLTFAITGILKEIILIALSMLVFGDRLIPINYVGIVISIGGIAAYNWLRLSHRAKRGKPVSVDPLQSLVSQDSSDQLEVLTEESRSILMDRLVHDQTTIECQTMTTVDKVKTRLSHYLSPFAPHQTKV
jgi:solute carrier family 35 protein C2